MPIASSKGSRFDDENAVILETSTTPLEMPGEIEAAGSPGFPDATHARAVALSTVTPVYRGAAYLERLVDQLESLRERLRGEEWPVRLAECVFVVDDADDNSEAVLQRIAKRHDWVTVLVLSRNFGQHPATVAGLLHTSGDWVATLDEDLQHEPGAIADALVAAVRSSSDLVYCVPERPPHGTLFRNVTSRLCKRAVALLSGNRHVASFSSFRLIRGDVARAAAAVSMRRTYLDVALCWFTDRIVSVPVPAVDVRHTETGTSGYSTLRLASHALRLLLSSQLRALRLGAAIGVGALTASTLIAITVLVQRLMFPASIGVPGWTSLLLAILFFGGLTALLLGVLLEYTSTVLMHVLGQPTFFVVDRSGDEPLRQFLEASVST